MRVLDPESLMQHVDRLYRGAWALCGSREDAEDLVQETFARVLSRPRRLHGGADFPYLMRAMRNTFSDGHRMATRRPSTVTTLDVPAEDPSPLDRPERALEVREVYAAIAELREEFRLAIVAVDVVGLSHREASKVLKIPEATVATRVFRARSRVAAGLLVPGERSRSASA
jgi:RNA polymerase sigma-70 factor, ECF subfamily